MRLISAVFVTLVFSLTLPGVAGAQGGSSSFVVNEVADENDIAVGDGQCDVSVVIGGSQCTLRAAVDEANADPDETTINILAGRYELTQTSLSAPDPATGDLDLLAPTTIVGAGARTTTIVGPNVDGVTDRVFRIEATAAMSGVTITRGGPSPDLGSGAGILVDGGVTTLTDVAVVENESNAASGGGIFVGFGAQLSLARVVVADNRVPNHHGGGLYNAGHTTITNSTFSENHASTGGGIATEPDGSTTEITWSTIADNSADSAGPAIHKPSAGTITVSESIVARNGFDSGCSGDITSQGNNFESGTDCAFTNPSDHQTANVEIGFLRDNGGPTDTQYLGLNSEVRDSVSLTGCPATDQRGVTRPQGALCDAGAVEADDGSGGPPPPVPTSLTFDPATATRKPGDPNVITATVQNNVGGTTGTEHRSVRWSVAGPNATSGVATTDTTGKTTITWNGANEGTDTLTAFVDTNGDGTLTSGEPTSQGIVIWEVPKAKAQDPLPIPGSIALDPVTATRTPGDANAISATVRNSAGGATEVGNRTIRWRVTGANPMTGVATTDATGKASISWEGVRDGTDTLTAFVDTNGDGAASTGEPTAQAVVNWVLPPPVIRKTVNIEPVSGTVLVKLPKGAVVNKRDPWAVAAQSGFIPLEQAKNLPLNTIVNATRGRVELSSAVNKTAGNVQSGEFYAGQFQIKQTSGAKPITDLVMNASLTCPKSSSKKVYAAARSRSLWGKAKGRFRTRGRHSSASVRGTTWFSKDTCTSTTTVVKEGTVVVNDFAKGKNVTVKAPKRYTARAKKKKIKSRSSR